MYEVNYQRASSVDDAVSKASAGAGGEAIFLSGGQSLLPVMKQRLAQPEGLVDISKIGELAGIEVSGNSVKIGAMTRHAEVAASKELEAVCPCITGLASQIGDPHVRHMGTIGGSVANYDPAADYPAALLALDATIHTNRREVKADEFFGGLFETALEEGELVTAVSWEAPDKGHYEKFRNPASRYAMAGVFVARTKDGVRAAVTGAGNDGVFRHEGLEARIAAGDVDGIEGIEIDEGAMLADLHGSAAYRANLVRVMAKRAARRLASGGGAQDHTQGSA